MDDKYYAEVVAITQLVAKESKGIKVGIVSEASFTPCGACLDWLIQFCDPASYVLIQGFDKGKIQKFRLEELCPYYPKQ